MNEPSVHQRKTGRILILTAVALCLLFPALALARDIEFQSSTQFLWGDDLLGEGEAILAEYMRFGITNAARYSVAGYGRISKDLQGGGGVRDNEFSGRLYYLYMDYMPKSDFSVRFGRQYVNFPAGSSVIDGLSVDLSKIGPIGVTVSGGTDVKRSLNSEHSALGDYFLGMDVRLAGFRNTRLDAGYIRRYDEWDRAREELGLNFRQFMKYVSPYAELKYDWLMEVMDQSLVGIDLFPLQSLTVKGEFYRSFPTFDSTSIYSVFAVDEYREYLAKVEYSFNAPVTAFASYVFQTFTDEVDEDAENYVLGARVFPTRELTLSADIDRRTGYGGKLWGFDIYGDYKVRKTVKASAGVQYDSYRRPESDDADRIARRFWLGGEWAMKKNVSLSARVEDNVNENFEHRPLGRVALNWKL